MTTSLTHRVAALIDDPVKYAQCTIDCAQQVFDTEAALKTGAAASGANVLSTRTKPGGATQGTSPASKFFRKVFGKLRFSRSVRAPTIKLGVSARTASVGAAAGRWFPVIGAVSLFPEAREMDFCVATCIRPAEQQ